MDAALLRSFFLHPRNPGQRQYEVLRAIFLEGQSMQDAAQRFGYRYDTVRALVGRFRRQLEAGEVPPFWPIPTADVPSHQPIPLLRRQPRKSSKPTLNAFN